MYTEQGLPRIQHLLHPHLLLIFYKHLLIIFYIQSIVPDTKDSNQDKGPIYFL